MDTKPPQGGGGGPPDHIVTFGSIHEDPIDIWSDPTSRSSFIRETILRGADTLAKLMAVTYLSQYENLNGEFARDPVFPPDFKIGYVPYSSGLIKVFNEIHERRHIHYPGIEAELRLTDIHDDRDIDYFIANGAQLFRLYEANRENLKKYSGNNLFEKVRNCVFRDEKLVKSLGYLSQK